MLLVVMLASACSSNNGDNVETQRPLIVMSDESNRDGVVQIDTRFGVQQIFLYDEETNAPVQGVVVQHIDVDEGTHVWVDDERYLFAAKLIENELVSEGTPEPRAIPVLVGLGIVLIPRFAPYFIERLVDPPRDQGGS